MVFTRGSGGLEPLPRRVPADALAEQRADSDRYGQLRLRLELDVRPPIFKRVATHSDLLGQV